jgi:hypothetical protein
MKKLTLVWNRSKDIFWDVDWVEYLFRNIPHDTVENTDRSVYYENSIIIDTICYSAVEHRAYCQEMLNRGLKFGLIDLGDETSTSPTDTYTQAEFVIRPLYRPGVPGHVLQIPLGFSKGFDVVSPNLKSTERHLLWSFIGQRWDPIRQAMYEEMRNIGPNLCHVAEQTGGRMSVYDMSKVYRDSIFVPAPRGWFTIDTYRVTEALEAGCIPIVEDNEYWQQLYREEVPFIKISSWGSTEALNIVKNISSNVDNLENLRLQCSNWWTKIKQRTTTEVEELAVKLLI